MAVSEDIISQEMDTDFNFERPRVFPTAERKCEEIVSVLSEEAQAAKDKRSAQRRELTPVDVCITVSSTCPWAVAGSLEAGAKLRFRVVPSMATIKYLRIIKKKKEEIVAEGLAKIAAAEARMKALLAADDSVVMEESDEEEEDVSAKKKRKKRKKEEGKDGGQNATKEGAEGAEDEAPGTARSNASKKSDASGGPGSGSGSGSGSDSDSDSDSDSYSDSNSDDSSKPPVDEDLERQLEIARKERLLELEWFETHDAEEQCWLSKSVKLYPGEYYVLVDISYNLSDARLFHLARPKGKSEAPWLDGRPLEVNKVWMQTSSTGQYQVRALHSPQQCPTHGVSVSSVTLQPQKWPFSAENQEETASRILGSMMVDLRLQCSTLGARFLTIAKDFKIKYRMKIKMYRQYVAEKEEEERMIAEKREDVLRQHEEKEEEERQMALYREREKKKKLRKQREDKFAAKRTGEVQNA